jgi:hypothetical protein
MPFCNAVPYVPILQDPHDPGMGLLVPPYVELDVFCSVDANNHQYGTGSVNLGPGKTINDVTVSSPDGSVSCVTDQNNLFLLNCSGDAFKPGEEVRIVVCDVKGPDPLWTTATCPVDYMLNTNTDMCEYNSPNMVPCLAPKVEVPGYGCLNPPTNGICQTGAYAGQYNGQEVCIPLGTGPECVCGACPAVCPQGLTIDEGNTCCSYPENIQPACYTGYSYDPVQNKCVQDTPPDPACNMDSAVVPTCGMEACLITKMVLGTSGGWVLETTCKSPCPVGPNGGPCNP